MATLVFWLQPRFKHIVERVQKSGNRSWYKRLGAFLLQILISIYGGYFGAGMGIIMLALLGFFVEGNIHRLNAIKTWLATIINVAASIFFITSNSILFLPGLALAVGQVIGGYWGARLAVRVDPNLIRRLIVAIGLILTVVFAWRL